MLGLDDVVLDVRIETVLVELVKIGRVEDGHVDVAGAEQIVDEHLFTVSAKLVERPHLLRRAEAAVKSVKAFDPALPILVFPILWVGVPEMHVAVDYKDVMPVMIVHVSLPGLRATMLQQHRGAARSIRHDRMNRWPPVPRAPYGQPRNGLVAGPRRAACLQGRRSAVQRGCSRGQVRLDAPNSAARSRPIRSRLMHRRAAGSQSCRPASTPRRAAQRRPPPPSSPRRASLAIAAPGGRETLCAET